MFMAPGHALSGGVAPVASAGTVPAPAQPPAPAFAVSGQMGQLQQG